MFLVMTMAVAIYSGAHVFTSLKLARGLDGEGEQGRKGKSVNMFNEKTASSACLCSSCVNVSKVCQGCVLTCVKPREHRV